MGNPVLSVTTILNEAPNDKRKRSSSKSPITLPINPMSEETNQEKQSGPLFLPKKYLLKSKVIKENSNSGQ